MHFAYGFGNLIGLCLFIFKWRDREVKDSYFDNLGLMHGHFPNLDEMKHKTLTPFAFL